MSLTACGFWAATSWRYSCRTCITSVPSRILQLLNYSRKRLIKLQSKMGKHLLYTYMFLTEQQPIYRLPVDTAAIFPNGSWQLAPISTIIRINHSHLRPYQWHRLDIGILEKYPKHQLSLIHELLMTVHLFSPENK